jgi:hypothetical protein
MPLRDHFRPPLLDQRPWRSFHATWCTALANRLNNEFLPEGYIALENVSPGPAIEIDVATMSPIRPDPAGNGATLTLPRTMWTPATVPEVFPFEFAEQARVEIHDRTGARGLVATIELVSPGNKDRERKRRLFTAKCASHLSQGVAVVIVDVVTTRTANLHGELLAVLEQPVPAGLPPLYTVAYRPVTQDGVGRIEYWPMTLALGQPLPAVPLSLEAECCVRVDLEAAYSDACSWRRLDEV